MMWCVCEVEFVCVKGESSGGECPGIDLIDWKPPPVRVVLSADTGRGEVRACGVCVCVCVWECMQTSMCVCAGVRADVDGDHVSSAKLPRKELVEVLVWVAFQTAGRL